MADYFEAKLALASALEANEQFISAGELTEEKILSIKEKIKQLDELMYIFENSYQSSEVKSSEKQSYEDQFNKWCDVYSEMTMTVDEWEILKSREKSLAASKVNNPVSNVKVTEPKSPKIKAEIIAPWGPVKVYISFENDKINYSPRDSKVKVSNELCHEVNKQLDNKPYHKEQKLSENANFNVNIPQVSISESSEECKVSNKKVLSCDKEFHCVNKNVKVQGKLKIEHAEAVQEFNENNIFNVDSELHTIDVINSKELNVNISELMNSNEGLVEDDVFEIPSNCESVINKYAPAALNINSNEELYEVINISEDKMSITKDVQGNEDDIAFHDLLQPVVSVTKIFDENINIDVKLIDNEPHLDNFMNIGVGNVNLDEICESVDTSSCILHHHVSYGDDQNIISESNLEFHNVNVNCVSEDMQRHVDSVINDHTDEVGLNNVKVGSVDEYYNNFKSEIIDDHLIIEKVKVKGKSRHRRKRKVNLRCNEASLFDYNIENELGGVVAQKIEHNETYNNIENEIGSVVTQKIEHLHLSATSTNIFQGSFNYANVNEMNTREFNDEASLIEFSEEIKVVDCVGRLTCPTVSSNVESTLSCDKPSYPDDYGGKSTLPQLHSFSSFKDSDTSCHELHTKLMATVDDYMMFSKMPPFPDDYGGKFKSFKIGCGFISRGNVLFGGLLDFGSFSCIFICFVSFLSDVSRLAGRKPSHPDDYGGKKVFSWSNSYDRHTMSWIYFFGNIIYLVGSGFRLQRTANFACNVLPISLATYCQFSSQLTA